MPAPVGLMPRKPVPAITLPLLGGGNLAIAERDPKNFTLLAVYRGYHCPKCRDQLQELRDHLADFDALGTEVFAISMDGQDRAEKARKEWETGDLPIAYDLAQEDARKLGLYLSSSRGMTSIGVEEATIFAEPGLFLVRDDGTLYAAWVQTVPFGRPKAADLLSAINFILDKDYPPRGVIEDY